MKQSLSCGKLIVVEVVKKFDTFIVTEVPLPY
jgi:hypothetical protein